MKRGTKRALWIVVPLLLLISTILFLFIKNKFITPLDYHSNLSEKEEVIEVYYVNWACDCSQWIETKYWEIDPDYETDEKDCIYLESENPQLQEVEDHFVLDYFQKD